MQAPLDRLFNFSTWLDPENGDSETVEAEAKVWEGELGPQ